MFKKKETSNDFPERWENKRTRKLDSDDFILYLAAVALISLSGLSTAWAIFALLDDFNWQGLLISVPATLLFLSLRNPVWNKHEALVSELKKEQEIIKAEFLKNYEVIRKARTARGIGETPEEYDASRSE